MDNIFPIFNQTVSRREKEIFLNQRSRVLWLVGLSGSGKSTVATALEKKLLKNGYFTMLLDGDNIRDGLNKNLTFTEEDRLENIRRVAEVAKLFVSCGVICICSFISPTQDIRNKAKEIIGEDEFLEIYINSPLAICEKRDVKGLYQKARRGEIKNFTGIDSAFEPPINPSFELRTDLLSIEESVEKLHDFLLGQIVLK